MRAGRTDPVDRAAIALGIGLLVLFALFNTRSPSEASHDLDLWAGLLFITSASLLLASRRFPATVALLTVAVSVVWYQRYGSRLIDVPSTVAFYVLGTTGDRRRELAVGGVSVSLLLFALLDNPSDAEIALQGIGWTVAAILSGELIRNRRLLLAEYTERAVRAEAERDAEAERRVAEERLRIAHDLHDVLAHTVSLMNVQAGVAADALDRGDDRDAARASLTTLRSAGKQAIAEVRATVAVLRTTGDRPDTAPAPGLARIGELVDAVRAQGLDVELDVDLDGVEVESLVELTAYRVVQESLTNVVRHAAATHAAVRIGSTAAALGALEPGGVSDGPGPIAPDPGGERCLVVEVVDDGRARSRGGTSPDQTEPSDPAADGKPESGSVTGGYGLRGMAERVAAVGGTLDHGPLPGRGWAVRATLPARGSGNRRPGATGRRA